MSTSKRTRLRRGVIAAAVVAVAAAVPTVAITDAGASSHREAPLIAADPLVDNTDVYAFTSPDKPDTVTLIANWFGLQEPNGGPNFYPWATDARYDINIDADGDAVPDKTFRVTFTTDDRRGGKSPTFLYNNGPVTSINDDNLLFRQNYNLELIEPGKAPTPLVRNGRAAPSNTGPASFPNFAAIRDQATVKVPGGGQVYVGPAEDSFFLDLRVFDLLYGGNLKEVNQDTLMGYNVNTIAIQVPKTMLALKNDPKRNPVIGVWSDTERRSLKLEPGKATPQGDFVQVSRLGNPLVNEVVASAPLKDAFNGLQPVQDAKVQALLDRVTDPELARLIQSIYGIPAPKTPRNDLVEIFLTGITTKAGGPIKVDLNSQLNNADVDPKKFAPSEMLRLNMSTPVTKNPNRLGVLGGDLQGFPNGRRLADDVVDIEIQAVVGAALTGKLVPALAKGDRVNGNDVRFGDKFPYVGLPSNQAVNYR
ncbi:DUF4331 domain-containing protein [Lentzea sp. NPDC051213]|uniref:DUF4331 domain-containing protein n=1 Tax=Lentzea sp. NPDC051213 TaxID=3364126 RepID=UPI0037A9E402